METKKTQSLSERISELELIIEIMSYAIDNKIKNKNIDSLIEWLSELRDKNLYPTLSEKDIEKSIAIIARRSGKTNMANDIINVFKEAL